MLYTVKVTLVITAQSQADAMVKLERTIAESETGKSSIYVESTDRIENRRDR